MFDQLSERLNKLLKNVRGQGKISETNVRETLSEVRKSLLDADVALPVVKAFLEEVRKQALGLVVQPRLNPGQAFVKFIHEGLVKTLGSENEGINFRVAPPLVILMAGLQGSGKTTTVAKLAKYLNERENKSVLVTSCDVYRPAAILQLETLAGQVDATFFPSHENQKPVDIAKNAIQEAKRLQRDVVIVDTAGRLHVDAEMMDEIQAIHKAISAQETLFVVDSMTGQDAANTAKAFNDVLPLTGVVLTKTDGDARGGAALSVKHITGKPIKFMGVGEKVDALEPFHPDRLASQILGMGDVLTLIEEMERKVDKEKAEKFAKKIEKGSGFDLEDFREQIIQLKNLGGAQGMLSKLPGMSGMSQMLKNKDPDAQFKRIEAIISSMTMKERRHPALIKGSRKVRIAKGSGVEISAVNQLLKQFAQMQKMMKKFSGGGIKKLMRGMQGMKNMPGMADMMSQWGGAGLPPGVMGGKNPFESDDNK